MEVFMQMARNLNTNTREIKEVFAREVGEWYSFDLKEGYIAGNVTQTESGLKILEVRAFGQPTVEEAKASLIRKGCKDVIMIPHDDGSLEARFKYSPQNGSVPFRDAQRYIA